LVGGLDDLGGGLYDHSDLGHYRHGLGDDFLLAVCGYLGEHVLVGCLFFVYVLFNLFPRHHMGLVHAPEGLRGFLWMVYKRGRG